MEAKYTQVKTVNDNWGRQYDALKVKLLQTQKELEVLHEEKIEYETDVHLLTAERDSLANTLKLTKVSAERINIFVSVLCRLFF